MPSAATASDRATNVASSSGAAEALAEAVGLTPTMGDVLYRRGHRDADALRRFLDPKLAELTDPETMADRTTAADRLAWAVKHGEPIAVFGDYDCDGITSAAIMTDVLRALGGETTTLLASRFDGGYGVSPSAVARIRASDAKVLVTCDCGSSDHEALAELSRAGLDVVVIDHHLVPDEPLPALAFLNPHRPDCGFAYKGMASCGLALSVAAALRKALEWKLDLRPWLDLVAIGTIADVAPLDGDNRALVRAGLGVLRSADRPGVRALLELAGTGSAPLTGEDVAFRIAPRLNAPGRLGPPDAALELLLARTRTDANAIAGNVEQASLRRREQQEQILAEAIEEIDREGWADGEAIVIGRQGWNPGIVGIVAGRLASRYGRPVIVAGFDGEVGRGSVRGPEGSRLHDALTEIAACLERYGGHQAAAGVEIAEARLGEVREAFRAACAKPSAADDAAKTAGDEPVPLRPNDDPSRVLADLARLEPCGAGNPAPRFLVEATVAGAREVNGGHLKLDLDLPGDGPSIGAFAPALGERANDLPKNVIVIAKLRLNEWRGARRPELLVESIEP